MISRRTNTGSASMLTYVVRACGGSETPQKAQGVDQRPGPSEQRPVAVDENRRFLAQFSAIPRDSFCTARVRGSARRKSTRAHSSVHVHAADAPHGRVGRAGRPDKGPPPEAQIPRSSRKDAPRPPKSIARCAGRGCDDLKRDEPRESTLRRSARTVSLTSSASPDVQRRSAR